MKKINRTILIMLITLTFLAIPSVYAFYFFNHESSIISKFIITNDLSDSYVRASIITYWIDTTSCADENDLTTCDISGKSAWNIIEDNINSDWIKLADGFYYYKNNINGNEITNANIKNSDIALINPELSIDELTNDQLVGIDVVPQYEIIYEFIEAASVENAWNVTYSSGEPTIIEITN